VVPYIVAVFGRFPYDEAINSLNFFFRFIKTNTSRWEQEQKNRGS
jgi:hypothetical protein